MSDDTSSPLTVRQGNALVKSAQTMDLNEKRLIMLAMSRIRWRDEEFLVQDIPITELGRWIGGNPYQEGRKAADGLLHRVVDILEEGGGQTKFQWTTLSAYIPAHKHKDGVACVRIRFNEELAPFLLQLRDRYNQIPLAHMLPMTSYNSQRLYEILWHDSHAGTKAILSYTIDQLKVYIGLRDKDGKWEKYRSWKDFKKVLDKAVEDFNAFGNLKIASYTGKSQTKRAYSHVFFRLERAEPREPALTPAPEPELDPETLGVVAELEAAGYTQNAREAVATYGVEVVRRTLVLARDAERKGAASNRPIRNLGGLVASILKKGVASQRVQGAVQEPGRLSNRDLDQLARALVDSYHQARSEHADAMWAETAEAQRDSIHDLMRVELSAELVDFLDRNHWDGNGYASIRNNYLLDTYPDELPDTLAEPDAFLEADGRLGRYPDEVRTKIGERVRRLVDDRDA